jgi:hypothetical protein
MSTKHSFTPEKAEGKEGTGILQGLPTAASSINCLHAAGRPERHYHDG